MKKAVSLFAMCAALAISFSLFASGPDEAPTGFDGLTNGSVLQGEMDAARKQFSEPEAPVPNGLGPLFNAVSCLDCHQSIADGGHSQIHELRAGHLDRQGNFVGATITLNNGSKVGPRSLINQRAICADAVGQLSPAENIRALRLSLPLFGDAFVERSEERRVGKECRCRWSPSH